MNDVYLFGLGFRFTDKSRKVAIDAMVREYARQEEPKRQYLEGKG